MSRADIHHIKSRAGLQNFLSCQDQRVLPGDRVCIKIPQDDTQTISLYATAAIIQELGEAGIALAKHAGVPLWLCAPGDLPDAWHEDQYLTLMEKYIEPFDEFCSKRLRYQDVYAVFANSKNGDIACNLAFAHHHSARPCLIYYPRIESAADIQKTWMHQVRLPDTLLSEKDFTLLILAHEATHARQAKTALRLVQSGRVDDILTCEIDADRGALEFVATNPHLFDASFDKIRQSLIMLRRFEAVFDQDPEHMTAPALGYDNIPNLNDPRLTQIAILSTMIAFDLRESYASELASRKMVRIRPGKKRDRYNFDNPTQALSACIAVSQFFMKSGEFDDQPETKQLVQDFLADIWKAAPKLSSPYLRPKPGI